MQKTEKMSSILDSLLLLETEKSKETKALVESTYLNYRDRENVLTQLWQMWLSVVPKEQTVQRMVLKL